MSVRSVSAAVFPPLPRQEALNLRDAFDAQPQSRWKLRPPESLLPLFSLGDLVRSGNDPDGPEKAEHYAEDGCRDGDCDRWAGGTDPEDRLELYRGTLEELGIGSSAAQPIRFPYKG